LLPPPSRWMLLVGRCRRVWRLRVRCRSDVSVLGVSILWISVLRVSVPCLRSTAAGGRVSTAARLRAADRIPAPGGLSTDDGPARGRVPAWKVRAPRRRRDASLAVGVGARRGSIPDRKSTRLNSSHVAISYAVFCLKKKNTRGVEGWYEWHV